MQQKDLLFVDFVNVNNYSTWSELMNGFCNSVSDIIFSQNKESPDCTLLNFIDPPKMCPEKSFRPDLVVLLYLPGFIQFASARLIDFLGI